MLKKRTVFCAAVAGTTTQGIAEFPIATTTTPTTATTTTAFASFELKYRLDDIFEQVFFLFFEKRRKRADYSAQKFSMSSFVGFQIRKF